VRREGVFSAEVARTLFFKRVLSCPVKFCRVLMCITSSTPECQECQVCQEGVLFTERLRTHIRSFL
jgi:hypothetical protein